MKQHFKHFYVLLAGLLLIFAFYMPVQAEEETEPTSIPLAQGQTLSGSFSNIGPVYVYYAITITEEQAITIYGEQTEGKYLSLSIYDQNMNNVDHKADATVNATYRWRTDILSPGNYYICVGSPYTMSYTIAYDPSPCPNAIPLTYGKTLSGSLSGKGYAETYYAITITQKQAITIYGTQTGGNDMGLSLYDQNMKHISSITAESNYKWRTDSLDPGNYYIGVSSQSTVINYIIGYAPHPYPDAILLTRNQTISGNVPFSYQENTYKIVLTEPLSITFRCTKNEGPYIYFELFDKNGHSVDNMFRAVDDAKFSWEPDKKLSAGTYFLSVSSDVDNMKYNISWQVKGPSAVDNLRASKKTASMITLKWKKTSGASKYIVYIYNSKKKTYKTYKTVTSTSCKVKKLKAATKYKFKVVPVMKYGSEQIMGDAEIINATTAPKKVNAPTITFRSSGTLSGVPVNYYTVKWKKVKGATGYEVYVKGHGTNGWNEAETTKSTSTTLYVVKGFSGQVKVRAYIKNNGGYSFGAFSKAKTINSR